MVPRRSRTGATSSPCLNLAQETRTHVTAYPKPAAGPPNFPALELEVLDYWDDDDTFRASIARRDDAPEYVFYDGPPFANGLPHYGHLLTGYVKDIVPRYRTMRGYKVERRFGWDTHGLPAELEVQRQLGISDKAQIEEMGIEKFNEACRASVLKYTNEWRAYVTRQARWVDFDNDYKTLDPTFMESVIWAFKQLWDKGLAYEGNRVLPYCWNDETPLSSHELRMDDDVYQSRQDPAITVGFRVSEGDLKDAYLLIWTTTPWTLPSNQAVAVNPNVTYVLGVPYSSITYAPGKTVTYTYDSRGLLSGVADWAGGSTAFTYNDAGELIAFTRPNSLGTQFTYDSNGRIASIAEDSGSSIATTAQCVAESARRTASRRSLVKVAIPHRRGTQLPTNATLR